MKVAQLFVAVIALATSIVLGAWLFFGVHSANAVATKIGYLAVAVTAVGLVIWGGLKCGLDAFEHYSDDEEPL